MNLEADINVNCKTYCDNITSFCDECAEAHNAHESSCKTCFDTGFNGDGCPICGKY